MEILDKESQLIAVEKVLEEMQKAEEYVKDWNASWWEQLLDGHCLSSDYEIDKVYLTDIERRNKSRYKFADDFNSTDSIGVVLVKEELVGYNALAGFGRIDWYDMNSHKSKRYFSFCNNGIIKFSKSSKVRLTLKHPRRISYDTSFNVLSNDFEVSITRDQLIDDWREIHKHDYFTLSLKDNKLVKRFNDIEIIENLSTGIRSVKSKKKYDKRNRRNNASVVFEATLNPDDSLEYGAVEIQTHKGNGKVNGTYRFDVSRKKGVRANFYSRKGVKIDLISNPKLLGTANTILLSQVNSNNSDDVIVSSFANSTQEVIARNLTEKVISFDNSDFNMESVNQAEKRIIEMVKCIRGELPLAGLIDRIDNCLDMIYKKQNGQIDGESNNKVLKLEPLNK